MGGYQNDLQCSDLGCHPIHLHSNGGQATPDHSRSTTTKWSVRRKFLGLHAVFRCLPNAFIRPDDLSQVSVTSHQAPIPSVINICHPLTSNLQTRADSSLYVKIRACEDFHYPSERCCRKRVTSNLTLLVFWRHARLFIPWTLLGFFVCRCFFVMC